VGAAAGHPESAGSAAAQTWPAFVLVAGLLLVGLVAAEDKLFSAAGHRLASSADSGWMLFAGVSLLIVAVTAVLNLDTAVAFVTPVVVHMIRRRGEAGLALVGACLLLANAGSLLLPGSNLTNLIVLGHLHLSGREFASQMGLPWVAAVAVTAAIIAIAGRREMGHRVRVTAPPDRVEARLGLAAVVAAAALVVFTRVPALPVLAVGAVCAGFRLRSGRLTVGRVLDTVGLPYLIGLFGLAVALGTAGRVWAGPSQMLGHLDPWSTAGVAATASVLLNNLPAASLLAAKVPPHPYSLLIGLNLGPNLFASGSLAWLLWLKAIRSSGGPGALRRTVEVGLVAAPLSIAAAVAALTLAGPGR
jgi:arsenical pump membrane protein